MQKEFAIGQSVTLMSEQNWTDPLRDRAIEGPEFGKTYEISAVEPNPLKPHETELFFDGFDHGFDAKLFVATESGGMGILRDICRDPASTSPSLEDPKVGVNRSYSEQDRQRLRQPEARNVQTPKSVRREQPSSGRVSKD